LAAPFDDLGGRPFDVELAITKALLGFENAFDGEAAVIIDGPPVGPFPGIEVLGVTTAGSGQITPLMKRWAKRVGTTLSAMIATARSTFFDRSTIISF
jgi:hypothetical protein